jgi:hypothetical protein
MEFWAFAIPCVLLESVIIAKFVPAQIFIILMLLNTTDSQLKVKCK